ncbi:DUF2871 family protein [Brevibacterium permense]|uniref:DUF2871 family protein n=1 Tax=Brevibacterium permense TaxID=234834 RepID=UPI00320B20D7
MFNAALTYMIIGVLSGLFYREFTKTNDFPSGEFTQLGLVLFFLALRKKVVADKAETGAAEATSLSR